MSDPIMHQILDELKLVRTDVSAIQSDISAMKADITSLQSDISTVKSDISTMKSDITSLQSDMSSVKSEVVSIKDTMATKQDVADIPLILRTVLETNETVKRLEFSLVDFQRKTSDELNTHEYSIDILNKRQLKTEAAIENLKNR